MQLTDILHEAENSAHKPTTRSLGNTKEYRLHSVSGVLNKNGHYGVEAFRDAAYNAIVDKEELEETLEELADCQFGGGGNRYFEVPKDVEGGFTNHATIRIYGGLNWDDDSFEIRDVINLIDAPKSSRLFVMVNANRTEHQWIVAEPQGAVYSG